jgi:hypothetical protein
MSVREMMAQSHLVLLGSGAGGGGFDFGGLKHSVENIKRYGYRSLKNLLALGFLREL